VLLEGGLHAHVLLGLDLVVYGIDLGELQVLLPDDEA
jgi:hypothetical protein